MSARYARQISLAEIGTAGQARIEAASIRRGDGDARASEIALEYLTRAGMRLDESGTPIDVASRDRVASAAGRPELIEAASFLAGALAATERLARAAGLEVRPISLPRLSSEP